MEEGEMFIQERHRKEKEDLISKIQQLRNSAKGVKKLQKLVKTEIAQLEQELKERHQQELNDIVERVDNELGDVNLEEAPSDTSDASSIPTEKRISKAQKRREKKEQEAKEREERIKAAEEEAKKGGRHLESVAITQMLFERSLQLYDIASDGNCMYNAIAHQLATKESTVPKSASELRLLAANEMRKNPDEYIPYVVIEDENVDVVSEKQYSDYCNKVERTTEWGGHVELKAIAAAIHHPIEVLSATAPSIHIGSSNDTSSSLVIVYHRKLYGLGEHYNSTRPLPKPSRS